jgi:hypothetical protein
LQRDEVPYEYVSQAEDTENQYGIEFLAFPCVKKFANDSNCLIVHTWKLPIHIQYHAAATHGGYVEKRLSIPALSVRPSKCRERSFIPQVSRFYRQTYLSRTGNYHLTDSEKYYPICNLSNESVAHFQMPVGDLSHLVLVEYGMIAVLTFVSIVLIVVFLKN